MSGDVRPGLPSRWSRPARTVDIMEYEEIDALNVVTIRAAKNADHQTCTQCGADCQPDVSLGADDSDVRIAFVYPAHGVNAFVEPFEDER